MTSPLGNRLAGARERLVSQEESVDNSAPDIGIFFHPKLTHEERASIQSAILHFHAALQRAVIENFYGTIGVRITRNRGKFGSCKRILEEELGS